MLKRKLPKGAAATVKSLQTVRRKCLPVSIAAVHILIKVSIRREEADGISKWGKQEKKKRKPCNFWQSIYKNTIRRTGEEWRVKESKLILKPSSNPAEE